MKSGCIYWHLIASLSPSDAAEAVNDDSLDIIMNGLNLRCVKLKNDPGNVRVS